MEERQHTDQDGYGALLILGGVAIGAALALLYAPRSGKRTRRQLRRTYVQVKERAADLGDELVERVEDLRELVAQRMEAGQEYLGQKKEDLLASLTGVEESIESLKRKVARR